MENKSNDRGINVKISLSLEYNPISKQLEEQKIKFNPIKMKRVEDLYDMVNTLRIEQILDNKMATKAYKTLKPLIIDAIIL